jgi:hypothetical protein
MHHHERISLIDALDVPAAKGDEPTKDAAAVVNDQLVSFVAGLSGQHKVRESIIEQQPTLTPFQTDVFNSTLLAELAASHLFDKGKELDKWYKKFGEVLQAVGWVVSGFK